MIHPSTPEGTAPGAPSPDRPSLSLELFPPRPGPHASQTWGALDRLLATGPDFASVTYRPTFITTVGGAPRAEAPTRPADADERARAVTRVHVKREHNPSEDVVAHVLATSDVPLMAHLTCIGYRKANVVEIVRIFLDMGVRRFLALRGDPPRGVDADDVVGELRHADELVAVIREVEAEYFGDGERHVHVAVAAYPAAIDHGREVEVLAAKQAAGADSAITQVFYDAEDYLALSRAARYSGVALPILPGIIPLTDLRRLTRLEALSGVPVPEELRGTYAAFGADSAGTRHLRRLAAAGIDTLHLLPTFDFATVPEDRARQRLPEIPEGTSPASRRPQAAVAAVADEDAFNWGYDPFHYQAPEGSYATAGHQDGGARTAEFRGMVGALHGMGLQVVLDQVYNHTSAAGQAPQSVLDRIVPGYYHRRDAAGAIEMSTCCNHVATEHAMAERLMIDSCVSWVQRYRVDGFRFDLMGYHSVDTMNRLREALDAVAEDAVGHPIFLYGEGWNMGEVANNALFTQAVQGQLGGTGVGTFNDRVRDALHGGTLFDVDPRAAQGLGTGELTDPNGRDERDEGSLRADLAWRTDLVRLSLAGNLRDMVLRTADGEHRRGEEIRYGDQSAAYGTEPVESIAYVDAHDDETLFDRLAYKLPIGTTMADRIRMNTVCLACVTLGQTPSFWAAGTEMLRSKSLDTDSYNSGDWFNAIDWSGQDNGWGRGLPPANRNFDQWIFQAELLSHEELRPSPHDIATATEAALDLLRLRRSSPLFSLGSAELVLERVSFPVGGDRAQPGVILMVIDDGAGEADLDPALDGLVIVINATPDEVEQQCDDLVGRFLELSEVQAEGADEVVRRTTFDRATGTVRVPGRTVAVLVEH